MFKAVPAPGTAMFSAVVATGAAAVKAYDTSGAFSFTVSSALLKSKPNPASVLAWELVRILIAWTTKPSFEASAATNMTSGATYFMTFFIFNQMIN